jgi:uncharacterized protein (DUF885 family)
VIEASALRLADDYWAFHRSTAQLWNVDRGDVDQIEQWEDFSPAGTADRLGRLDEFARRAEDLQRAILPDRDRQLVASVGFSARSSAAILPYARDMTLVAGALNMAAFFTVMVPAYGLTTREHGHGYLRKLRGIPSFIDSWIAGLQDGISKGRCAPARGIRSAIADLDAMLSSEASDDPLVRHAPPVEMSEREVEGWRAEIVDCVDQLVRPALVRLRHHLQNSALPAARSDEQPGICHLDGGSDDYHGLLNAATSTELTPEGVHQIGRDQLAGLDDEYRVLGAAALGIGDPAEQRARLRDDPSFRYASSAEVITDAVAACSRASAAAPGWFTRVPVALCSAVAVDAGPLAYYTAPSPDGARGGTYFCNTADPTMWTRFSLEANAFHESVPGHHLQLALAQELGLHPILGELEVTSYSEGWGLYAERLADEMALYSGPLQRVGMLTLDSLRAARLVVDTGLHAFGWTRDDAITFLAANTSLAHANAAREVDRYIADPAQATSYMIGRLEIERLRTHATSRLGHRFSLAEFHNAVLGNGMLPLTELRTTIEKWIDGTSPL